jgi:immune inhibitor A
VAGQTRTLNLGPQEYNSAKPQAVVVVLPKRSRLIDNGPPAAGERQWFSGNDDDLRNTLTAPIDLTGKASATLTSKIRYAIEATYDYLYIEASEDGTAWTPLGGTVDGHAFSKDSAGRPAIDGRNAGWAEQQWADLSVPLDAYAGKSFQLRFRYRTDGGTAWGGVYLDNLTVTADGSAVLSDGAEGGGPFVSRGWTAEPDSEVRQFDNYYIAGHRSYVQYDRYLKTGPYFFGYSSKPDYVDHYAYQQGLLVSYWDTYYKDNDTYEHPGEGRNLISDAHPRPFYRIDGQPWRARVQVYDAPFSLTKADSFTLHVNDKPSYIRGQDAQPLFDDTKQYWFPELPNHGVKLPAAGVKIKVQKQDGTSMKVKFS